MACDAQSLVNLAASRGYAKLSKRQLDECWCVGEANSAGGAFSYKPATSIITWTDINGAGQQGDLAFFNATANKPTVSFINMTDGTLTSVSNLSDLAALTRVDIENSAALTSLDASNLPLLGVLVFINNGASSLTLTGDVSLTDLRCFSNQLTSITGLSTCVSLTTLVAYGNLFTTLNLNFMPAHVDTIDVSNNPNLTSLVSNSIAVVSGDILMSDCTGALVVNFSALTTVGNDLIAQNVPNMVSFSAALLDNANTIVFDTAGFASLALNSLTTIFSSIAVINCPNITSITLNSLAQVTDLFNVSGHPLLTTFSFPSFAGPLDTGVVFSGNTSMVSYDLTKFTVLHADIDCSGCTSLTSAILPPFGLHAVNFHGCTLLASLTLTGSGFSDSGQTIDFGACALAVGNSTHGVDGILARGVFSGVSTLTFVLDGGANAQPSACTDVNTLRTEGNVVSVNGPC
jgi:hypothetical protein